MIPCIAEIEDTTHGVFNFAFLLISHGVILWEKVDLTILNGISPHMKPFY